MTYRPTAIDLYAGAGLFSHAFQKEGFKIIEAFELDPFAASTYKQNVGAHIKILDVRKAYPTRSVDLVIAGPPCQGFSTLGKRDPNDPRNLLSLEVLRWLPAAPKVIVIENVAAFLDSVVWKQLYSEFKNSGYEVEQFVLNSFDYGVPQHRRRSFTVASKIGLPVVRPIARKHIRTVREAWRGLAEFPDGRNHHVAPIPSDIALQRMKMIPAGGDRRNVMTLAPDLAPPSWIKLQSQVTDAWGRMQWDKPSNTIRTALQNASKGRYIHPDQNRVITLREAARLQSIGDAWRFCGPNNRVAQQIGNSVPPLLGRAIARALQELFH